MSTSAILAAVARLASELLGAAVIVEDMARPHDCGGELDFLLVTLFKIKIASLIPVVVGS